MRPAQVLIATLFLTSACSPTEVDGIATTFSLREFNVATGAEFGLSPRISFTADDCAVSPSEFHVRVDEGVLSILETDVMANRDPNTSRTCIANVYVRLKATRVGQSDFDLAWDRQGQWPVVFSSLEVRDADHLTVNLLGHDELSMLEGQTGILQASLADRDGNPLVGGAIQLSGDLGSSFMLEPSPLLNPNTWKVHAVSPGAAMYTLSADNGLSLTSAARVLAASDLSELRLFSLTVTPVSAYDANDSWHLWKTFAWTPITTEFRMSALSQPAAVIAAPVDSEGHPVYVGPGVSYTVEQFPTLTVEGESMEMEINDGTSDAMLETAWLSVTPRHSGTSTMTATWNGLSATTSLTVE